MMAHSHTHNHNQEAQRGVQRALAWALVLNGGFLLIEAAVGWWTGSLALLSDAVHMLGDVAALMLAYTAARISQLKATPGRSYGLVRAETLGAFVNAIGMLVACVIISVEAIERMLHTLPAVAALPVMLVGSIGLAINLGSAWKLWQADKDNLNIRGALVHMMADALGSVGAIIAAGFLHFGMPLADPLMAILIVLIVLWSTWGLLRDSTAVLLQFAPSATSAEDVHHALCEIEGIEQVHDLHLWTLDGRMTILTAHIVGTDGAHSDRIRQEAETLLSERFDIRHSTIQTEIDASCAHNSCSLFAEDQPPPPPNDHAHDHT